MKERRYEISRLILKGKFNWLINDIKNTFYFQTNDDGYLHKTVITCHLLNDWKELDNKQAEGNQKVRFLDRSMVKNAHFISEQTTTVSYVISIISHKNIDDWKELMTKWV